MGQTEQSFNLFHHGGTWFRTDLNSLLSRFRDSQNSNETAIISRILLNGLLVCHHRQRRVKEGVGGADFIFAIHWLDKQATAARPPARAQP